jgi:hypothetical protein
LDQVEKLVGSIKTAMGLFQDAQAYGRLLSNAPGSVDGYSWERAASEYASLYETARRADLLVAQRVG